MSLIRPVIVNANARNSNGGTLVSAGGGEDLVVDGAGPDFSIKGLTAGTNITLTPGANDVTINTPLWQTEADAVTFVRIGTGATGLGVNRVAIGIGADAEGNSSIALGTNADADTDDSIVMGRGAAATVNTDCIAIGQNSAASGTYSVALGALAESTHNNAVALGVNAKSRDPDSVTFNQRRTVAATATSSGAGTSPITIYTMNTDDETAIGNIYVSAWEDATQDYAMWAFGDIAAIRRPASTTPVGSVGVKNRLSALGNGLLIDANIVFAAGAIRVDVDGLGGSTINWRVVGEFNTIFHTIA